MKTPASLLSTTSIFAMSDERPHPDRSCPGLAFNFNNTVITGGTFTAHLPSREIPSSTVAAASGAYGTQRRRGKPPTLEETVVFEAMLHAVERYPAPKCDPDTRQEAQRVVTDWIQNVGSMWSENIMWLSGAPGVGKSAIVQTVCEALDGPDSPIGGCQFFGRGQGDREKAFFFPATIAYQLGCSDKAYHTTLNKIIEDHPMILRQTLECQFRKLLLDPIVKLANPKAVTIVIDGLDECNSVADQVMLLELIYAASTKYGIRFLIASRPEQAIHGFFQRNDVRRHVQHVRLDEESFNTSRDIYRFLSKHFARIRQSRPGSFPLMANGEQWPGTAILRQLTTESDAQFIYPRLIIDSIDSDPLTPPDEQLQSILTSTAPNTFSKLDSLYHQILSRCLQTNLPGHLRFKEVLMGILQVIIAWPKPLSPSGIADVLDEERHVVENVIRGPMRCLFKFNEDDPESPVVLCHKSLRDCVLDPKRSGQFLVQSNEPDILFLQILSRPSPADPRHSYSRVDMVGVIRIVFLAPSWLTILDIASVLDIQPDVVHNILYGPQRSLFNISNRGQVDFSPLSGIFSFLGDINRSGDFSTIADGHLDDFFIQILSRPLPVSPQLLISRQELLGVIQAVLVWSAGLMVPDIALVLDVNSAVVQTVIHGPQRSLFCTGESEKIGFKFRWRFTEFLMDSNRSKEFFISDDKIDALFMRILSHPPLLHLDPQQSKQDLKRVLHLFTTSMAGTSSLTFAEIASFLGVKSHNVSDIIGYGPQRLLFSFSNYRQVRLQNLSQYLLGFLHTRNCSGEFFIPDDLGFSLFIQILSRPPPTNPRSSFSRQDLKDIIRITSNSSQGLTISEVALALGIGYDVVWNVVYGPQKPLFVNAGSNGSISHTSFFSQRHLFALDLMEECSIPPNLVQLDDLFLLTLQRPPSTSHQHTFSRQDLKGVLHCILVWPRMLTVSHIASLLDIADDTVWNVINDSQSPLFTATGDSERKYFGFAYDCFGGFLMDAVVSGEFFIPDNTPDTLFIQILSRPSPADPERYFSRQDLMGVLREVMAEPDGLTVDDIASLLGVKSDVVYNVISGPQRSLFRTNKMQQVGWSFMALHPFFRDVSRSGTFFCDGSVITTT